MSDRAMATLNITPISMPLRRNRPAIVIMPDRMFKVRRNAQCKAACRERCTGAKSDPTKKTGCGYLARGMLPHL